MGVDFDNVLDLLIEITEPLRSFPWAECWPVVLGWFVGFVAALCVVSAIEFWIFMQDD